MKKLIEFLFSGCWHEWETIKEVKYTTTTKYVDGRSREDVYTVYTLRCKKCGEITSKQIGVE